MDNKKGLIWNNLHSWHNLSMPQPCNSLSDAHIVGLKRIERNAECDGSNSESPHSGLANGGNTLGGEVVNNARPGKV
jgi:hypothetical protein